MTIETKQLEIEEHEEDLLKLWKEAVNKFQAISSAKFKQSISTGQYERLQDVIQQPARWSRIFSKNREPEGNLEKLCDRVGEHLDGIEMGIKALGFGFKVAAAVAPVLSPAELAVTALTWLFASFSKVSEKFDKIEEFFSNISGKFKNLSTLAGKIHQIPEHDRKILKEWITDFFVATLEICGTGISQPKHVFKSWLNSVFQNDENLNSAFKKLEGATEGLHTFFTYATYVTTVEARNIGEKNLALTLELKNLGNVNIRFLQQMIDKFTDLSKGVQTLISFKETKERELGAKELPNTQVPRGKGDMPAAGLKRRSGKFSAAGKGYDLIRLREHVPRCEQAIFVRDLKDTFVEQTWTWFLEGKKFQDWYSGKPPVLWLKGESGVGKTFVAHAIAEKAMKDEKKIAYFYFRKDADRYSPKVEGMSHCLRAALSTMINQIAEQEPDLCRQILAEVRNDSIPRDENGVFPDINELWGKYFVKRYQKKEHGTSQPLYLIFDGIDEAEDDAQKTLLRLLSRIPQDSRIRVFVTSRTPPEASPEGFTPRVALLSKRESRQDLERSFKTLIWRRMKSSHNMKRFRKQTKHVIASKLSESADGMLYVEHMLQIFDRLGREQKVVQYIEEGMPLDLFCLYDRIFREWKVQWPEKKFMALKDLLIWLIDSKRPLSVKEASEVIRISAGDPEILDIEEEVVGSLSGILEIVRTPENEEDQGEDDGHVDTSLPISSFVALSEENTFPLQLQKRSLRDYFEDRRTQRSSLQTSEFLSHLRILETCATILSRPDNSELGSGSLLIGYAAENWALHLKRLNEVVDDVGGLPKEYPYRVVNALAQILGNPLSSCKHISKFATKDYSELIDKNWENWVEQWVAQVKEIEHSVGDQEEQKVPMVDLAKGWINAEITVPEKSQIMLGIAKGHADCWLNATTAFEANRIFIFARNAFFLYLSAAQGQAIAMDSAPAEDSVLEVAKALFPSMDHPKVYRALGLAQVYFQHDEDAKRNLQKSLEMFETPLDSYHSYIGLAEVQSRGNDDIQEAIKSLEAAWDLAIDLTDDEGRMLQIDALIKRAYLQNDLDDPMRVTSLLIRAMYLSDPMPLEGKILNLLTIALASLERTGYGFDGLLIQYLRGYISSQNLESWVAWAFHEEDNAAIERFEKAATKPEDQKSMLATFEKVIKSNSQSDWLSWARYRVSKTYRTLRKDPKSAMTHLECLFKQEHLPQSKDILYNARLEIAEIIYSEFLGLRNRDPPVIDGRMATLEEHRSEVHKTATELRDKMRDEIPKLGRDDLDDSLLSVCLARMERALGNMTEYQSILDNTFQVCVNGLSDDERRNDCMSFRLLAKVLSCVDGLETDCQVALSLQFSTIPTGEERSHGSPSPSPLDEESDKEEGADTEQNPGPPETETTSPEPQGGNAEEEERDVSHVDDTGADRTTEPTVNGEIDQEEHTDVPIDREATETGESKSYSSHDGDLPTADDREDLEFFYVTCDGCDKQLFWWKEHLFHCLVCINVDLCMDCYQRLNEDQSSKRLAEEASGNRDRQQYCGKDHKHVKGPIPGWRGVKDGEILTRDKPPFSFDNWLQGLRNERWPAAWRRFWTGESMFRNIGQ